jgi:plasmid maintenance system antidote protein VapI
MARPPGSGNFSTHVAHPLLDAIRIELKLSSDGKLCDLLKVSRSTLSKLRHGTNNVSADFILRVHKVIGWPVEKIESYLPEER